MDTKIHPAVTVSNIRNFIPITLDNESAQYVTWSELFRIHCTAYLVDSHLEPRQPPPVREKAKEGEAPSETGESWKRLDAIVLQWIYGTISPDLLRTILKKNTTAYDTWSALENMFQDNKASRALHLQTKLTNTRLESFKDMAAYCQEIKILADQLHNVDVPLTQTQLVLQLLGGLIEPYKTIASIIRNKTPLPDFNDARSTLCHEETHLEAQALHAAQAAGTALHAGSSINNKTTGNQTAADSKVSSNRPPETQTFESQQQYGIVLRCLESCLIVEVKESGY